MWLLNSQVPSRVTDNLVQHHVVGTNNYPENVKQAYTMMIVAAPEADTATSLAQTYEPGWPCEGGDRSKAAAVDEVAGEAPDKTRGAAVANAQMGETSAISVAVATIFLVIAPMMPMSGEVL